MCVAVVELASVQGRAYATPYCVRRCECVRVCLLGLASSSYYYSCVWGVLGKGSILKRWFMAWRDHGEMLRHTTSWYPQPW